MDRTQKIDCGTNGEVIFTGATIKFQLKEGLTHTSQHLRLIFGTPDFSNMGNVPSTHIFIENLCRAGYEMGVFKRCPYEASKGVLCSFGGLPLQLDITKLCEEPKSMEIMKNRKGGYEYG
jgi:hypothetical protein